MTADMMVRSDADLLDGERAAFVLDVGVVQGCRVEGGVLVRDTPEGTVPAVGVTPLPKPGDRVSLPGEVGVWVATVGEDAAGGFVTGRMMLDGRVVERELRVACVDARTRVVGSVGEEAMVFVRALASECEAKASQALSHQRWVDGLVSDAHDRANDEGYCEQFDDFMEAHGLPRREREYTVRVEVVAQVRVSVTATSAAEAEGRVDREAVWQAMGASDIDSTHVEDVALDD